MIIISHSYNFEGFKEFVNIIKDKSYPEMVKWSKKELHEVRARKKGDTEYADILRGFLFFIQWGKKPNAINDQQFQLFRPVCENLAHKSKTFCYDDLKLFEN